MNTDADLAASFYGAPTPPSNTAAIAPSGEQTTADILFGNTTKAKLEQTQVSRSTDKVDVHNDQEMGELMFKDSPIYEDSKLTIKSAAEHQYLANPDDAAKIAESWEPTLRAFQLNSTEASDLTTIAVALTVNPPEPDTAAAWVGDAKSALRDAHGDKAGEALQAAQQLIARDPAVVRWLEQTGLGNHPKFVRLAAAKAIAMKARGRL